MTLLCAFWKSSALPDSCFTQRYHRNSQHFRIFCYDLWRFITVFAIVVCLFCKRFFTVLPGHAWPQCAVLASKHVFLILRHAHLSFLNSCTNVSPPRVNCRLGTPPVITFLSRILTCSYLCFAMRIVLGHRSAFSFYLGVYLKKETQGAHSKNGLF